MSKKVDIKNFSEIAKPFDAEKIDSLIGRNVIIWKADFTTTIKGECVVFEASFDVEAKHQKYYTFSKVIIEQLKRGADKLPFRANIKKVRNYYTLE